MYCTYSTGWVAPATVAKRCSLSTVAEHDGASARYPWTDLPSTAATGSGTAGGDLSHRPAASSAPTRGLHPAGPPVTRTAATTTVRGTTVRYGTSPYGYVVEVVCKNNHTCNSANNAQYIFYGLFVKKCGLTVSS